MQVAIDGPAGVGKSTIGERLARRLGALYVDTGAFYRTLTVVALRQHIAETDVRALAHLARNLAIAIQLPAVRDGRQYTVLVDGEDVTPQLRTPQVEYSVSRMSSHDEVRAALIARMRDMADAHDVVMVGRDIGTVVLPHADLKIFLTTSIEERAIRRHGDLVARFGPASPTLEAVRGEIAERDAIDAPHTFRALDAVEINNDHLQADDVVDRIVALLAARQTGKA